MIFVHGSKQDIDVDEGFQLFNYVKYNDRTKSNKFIDNGEDAEGCGLYAWIGKSEKSFKEAARFTSADSGFAYVIEVDIEEEDLMNNRDPYEISTEMLAEAIDLFVEKKRDILGYNKDLIDSVISRFEDDFDIAILDDVNEVLEDNGIKMVLDEYTDPGEFSSFDEWKDEIDETFINYEPCSHIMDEGGSLAIAEYIQRKSDNLWDVLKHLGNNIVLDEHSGGISVYNKTFQESILETFPDHNLTATYVNNDNFAIIFDTSKADIIEKIDLNLKSELKKEIDKPKSRKNNRMRI